MHKLIYIALGDSFTHECPGEFTDFNWTFRSNNKLMTSNKSIHIVKVKQENSGKYTCWTTLCNGHVQNLLTINLCVVTGRKWWQTYVILNVLFLSCYSEDSLCLRSLGWDVIFNNTNSSVAANTSEHVDLFGSITCSAKQMFDGYTTVSHVPLHVFNQTAGECLTSPFKKLRDSNQIILVQIFLFHRRIWRAVASYLWDISGSWVPHFNDDFLLQIKIASK